MKIGTPLASLLIAVLLLAIAGCGRSQDPGEEPEAPPLIQAGERGDLKSIESLLRRDPRPDVRDACQWTPLMKAALNGHLDAARRLLDAGAQVDAQDKGGYTPMMLAASNDHAAIVDLLVERGAEVNRQERTQGWTALIWAAKQGHVETVKTLLRQGADPGIRDLSGRRAADWARESRHPETLALVESARDAPR